MIHHINNQEEITDLIRHDEWMMKVLSAAESLNLPDWWIGAGFLRNKVWDYMEGKDSEPTRDVDLVYFNANDMSPEIDWTYDTQLAKSHPFAEWEVRNQARMHYKNDFAPFTSTADGIAHWTETATAVAVRIKDDVIEYLFCYGTEDLFELIARPTPYIAAKNPQIFLDRVEKKQWRQKWPDLQVIPA